MNETRWHRLLCELEDSDFTHVVFAPGASWLYLTGMAVHSSERLTLLGVNREGKIAVVLPRLEADGIPEGKRFDGIFTYGDEEGPEKAMADFSKTLAYPSTLKKVGVEQQSIRMFEVKALERHGMSPFARADELVMKLRLAKDDQEILALKKAAYIVDNALTQAIPNLRIGMSEIEMAAELEYQMRRLGSEGAPFTTIVGAGERGALPHGQPSQRMVAKGDLVVFDYGATIGGYAADTTRTLAFGEPSDTARTVYDVVKLAQAAALQSIRPGVRAHEVDQAARDVIENAGYGAYFTHRTGHGLGLDVHEYPSIVSGNDLELIPGMVFTVEPGIYLPGQFGVRIEDDVVVTQEGKEVITTFTKELTVVDS